MHKLIKAILKTGSGTAVSIFFGIIAMKIMAWLAGPAGVGLFSLIRQTQQTAITIGGGQVPLTQGLASQSGENRNKYLSEVSAYILLLSICATMAVYLLAPWFGPLIFGDQIDSVHLVKMLCIPIGVGFAFVYFNAILNGNGALNKLIISQIINAAIVACLAYPTSLLFNKGLSSAFVFMLALGMLSSMLYSFAISYKAGWLNGVRNSILTLNFKSYNLKKFISFSTINTFTSLFTTLTVLIIRSLVAHNTGLYGAGIFDVAWTLSMMYLQLILSAFASYYLPTLSGINNKNEQVLFIRNFLFSSIILVVPIIVLVIVGKPLVIKLFYTNEFNPALKTIRWMLIGDFFKVISWVLAIPMVAFADVKTFFWSELIGNIALLFCVYLALYVFRSTEHIGVAFLLNYVLYFIYTLYYVRHRCLFEFDKNVMIMCFTGLMVVVAASFHTWCDVEINWIKAFSWFLVSSLVSLYWFFQTKKQEGLSG